MRGFNSLEVLAEGSKGAFTEPSSSSQPPLVEPTPTDLEEAALAALARRFVGRRAEREALLGWLAQASEEPRVVWIGGPAGIGKSALAQVFAHEARSRGHRVEQSAARASALGRGERPDLVILDGLDELELRGALDQLLRESGATLMTVAVGRGPLPEPLRDHPHLETLTRTLTLRPLDDADAEELLVRRDVPPAEAARLAPLAAGSPGVLVELAARARLDRPTPIDARAPSDLDDALAQAAYRAARDHLESRALDALAVLGELDVATLARVLGIAERSDRERDARSLWDWLAGQAFVARQAGSIACLPTMRKALLHHVRGRDPAFVDRVTRAGVSPEARLDPAPSSDAASLLVPLREAFAARHRPHALRASPLTRLACVRRRGEPAEEALAATLDALCDELALSPGYADAGRLLRVTYLDPTTTKQEAAAAALGLPFGTYRYQLRRAIELAAEALAVRETDAARR